MLSEEEKDFAAKVFQKTPKIELDLSRLESQLRLISEEQLCALAQAMHAEVACRVAKKNSN